MLRTEFAKEVVVDSFETSLSTQADLCTWIQFEERYNCVKKENKEKNKKK